MSFKKWEMDSSLYFFMDKILHLSSGTMYTLYIVAVYRFKRQIKLYLIKSELFFVIPGSVD
jgi:hypothetical protein